MPEQLWKVDDGLPGLAAEDALQQARFAFAIGWARALGVGVEFTALVAMAVAGTVSWARTIFCWFE